MWGKNWGKTNPKIWFSTLFIFFDKRSSLHMWNDNINLRKRYLRSIYIYRGNLGIRHRSAAVITIIVRLIIKFKYYCAEKKFLFFFILEPNNTFLLGYFLQYLFFCSIWLSTRSNETLTNYQTTASIDRSNPAFWFL